MFPAEQDLSRRVQLLGKKGRPTHIRMQALHDAGIGRADVFLRRAGLQPEGFKRLAGGDLTRPASMAMIAFSFRVPPVFFFPSLAFEPCESCPRPCASLIGGELVESQSLLAIPMQAATTLFETRPKLRLPPGVSFVGEELVDARGLFIIGPQAIEAL